LLLCKGVIAAAGDKSMLTLDLDLSQLFLLLLRWLLGFLLLLLAWPIENICLNSWFVLSYARILAYAELKLATKLSFSSPPMLFSSDFKDTFASLESSCDKMPSSVAANWFWWFSSSIYVPAMLRLLFLRLWLLLLLADIDPSRF